MKISKRLYPILSALFWIGIWWLAALLIDKDLILPTPLTVAKTLLTMLGEGSFYRTVGVSLLRVLSGILLAFLFGALLAISTTQSRFCYHLFSPILTLLKATPVASVIFLLLLWLGRNAVPLFISFAMALPIIWSNLHTGIGEIDGQLLEMADLFGFTRMKKILFLHLPALFPYFLSACRASISLAFKAGIAAEVLCLPELAIGRAIYEGNWYLQTDRLFAWTLVTVLISAIIESATLAFLRRGEKHKFSGGAAK